MIDYIIYFFTISILLSNIIFVYLYFKLKNSIKSQPKSYELQMFMKDLLNGDGIVRISRVDPNDIFLRSPRQ